MERIYTNRSYLDAIQHKIIVFDGAMGTNLQLLNLSADHFGGEITLGCNDFLVISHPQAVESVHRSFLEAGVDVIETCTFRANRLTLADYGLQDRVVEINTAAAKLARALANEFSKSGQQRFVAGSIGPSGKLPSMSDPEMAITFDELAGLFKEQALALLEGGVDLIIIETSQDILEVKATIHGVHMAFEESGIHLPIQAQVTLDTTGRMLLGTDILAALTILEGLPIDVIGMNCSTGPEQMREPISILSENSSMPVSCLPNAGLPLNVDGQAVYPLEPEPFANAMAEFVNKFHINVVGGCCGTTPTHLSLLIEKVKNLQPQPRSRQDYPRLASGVQAVSMLQDPSPFLIGERLNSQGSRIFKNLLLKEDYEAMITVARNQIDNGAHGLDVCVALTERADEPDTVKKVIQTVSPAVKAPLIFDSTEPEVLEAALKTFPGRSLINSTNLESGREKADKIFNLAKRYNAAVIVLTIDENGMAKTAQRKLEIARRIYDIAVTEHGLRPCDLVYDDLTFTLATGDPEYGDSAAETIEGIKQIKAALPGVLTSLGVSNVSFGLTPPARAVLNSIMLYHCVQAGLDMAIVNPAQITPYSDLSKVEIDLAEDLIFNRRPDALQRLIEYFEKNASNGVKKEDQTQHKLQTMGPAERLHWKIVHRMKEGVEDDVDALILTEPEPQRSIKAVDVLNNALLPAMKEVGDKFGSGELILPFVLQSAEVMKKTVSHLETYLARQEGVSKGKLVLATVYGDVHDIGKNLVKTILSNNGYDVVDLGKQVPAETFIEKAVEHKADAVGLSALLVSTSKQMPLVINELHRRKINVPVLIGGAAINRSFGRRILMTEEGEFFPAGVYYCKDAFEGLSTMDTITDPVASQSALQKVIHEAELELGRASEKKADAPQAASSSSVSPAGFIPAPQTWGPRIVQTMPLETVFQHLSKNELFRLSWGAKNTHGEEWAKLQIEFEDRLDEMRRQALSEGWLKPRAVYGYWPCQSLENDLILYDPASLVNNPPVELMRLSFPRQSHADNLCLADYFSPVTSNIMDVVALQIVTVGAEATQRVDRLQAENNFTEAYFTHGLGVQMAEAAADFLHNHIRRELNLAPDQGKRYSWGYPAIPDLEDHAKVFQLLPAERELGMQLTSAYQLVPEQSTAAIILHHSGARYFNIGDSRIDQLMR